MLSIRVYAQEVNMQTIKILIVLILLSLLMKCFLINDIEIVKNL